MSGLQNCSIMKKNMRKWHMLPIRMVMAMLVKELRTFWKKDILLFDVCMEMTVLRQYHFNSKEQILSSSRMYPIKERN